MEAKVLGLFVGMIRDTFDTERMSLLSFGF